MSISLKSSYYKGLFCVLLSAFLFALKGTLIKLAYAEGADTTTVLTFRMGISLLFYLGILFSLFLKNQPIGLSFTKEQKLMILGLSVLGYYVSAYLNFYGLNFITASLERVILYIYPTFVLLINYFVLKEKISRKQLLAMAICYGGIILAFVENLHVPQTDLTKGSAFVILSGLTYSFYMVGSQKAIKSVGVALFTTWTMILASVMMVTHGIIENGTKLLSFNAKVYAICSFMAVFSTVIPTFLYAYGIKKIGSSDASIGSSIGPVFTLFLANWFLNEQISSLQTIGTLLVITGVLMLTKRK